MIFSFKRLFLFAVFLQVLACTFSGSLWETCKKIQTYNLVNL